MRQLPARRLRPRSPGEGRRSGGGLAHEVTILLLLLSVLVRLLLPHRVRLPILLQPLLHAGGAHAVRARLHRR